MIQIFYVILDFSKEHYEPYEVMTSPQLEVFCLKIWPEMCQHFENISNILSHVYITI